MDLEQIYFLDLFSGTGSISYELMSRGATKGQAVDIALASHKYRQRFIQQMEFDGLRSIQSEGLRFLRQTTTAYDLIFADPPYDFPKYENIVELVFQNELLKPQGILVLEHPEEHTFERRPYFVEHRRYGRVNFSFFKKEQ